LKFPPINPLKNGIVETDGIVILLYPAKF